MARPTKYNPAIHDAICNRLKAGCTRVASAESCGIDYDTFRNWMVRYSEFSASVTRAESEAEAMFTATLARAAQGTDKQPPDWRAAESWLKRRRRSEWGDSIDVRKLDDETLLRLLAIEDGGEPARTAS